DRGDFFDQVREDPALARHTRRGSDVGLARARAGVAAGLATRRPISTAARARGQELHIVRIRAHAVTRRQSFAFGLDGIAAGELLRFELRHCDSSGTYETRMLTQGLPSSGH